MDKTILSRNNLLSGLLSFLQRSKEAKEQELTQYSWEKITYFTLKQQ